MAEYQNALEKGLALICSAVGLESEHYDDDSKTDVENYLDCFADAANWLEHCVYWDRDAGCIVISKPPKAEPVSWVKYTVQPAESLAGIAIRQLGDESRAGEIGLLNNVPCEDAPLYPFEPGDVIRLPILAPQPPKAVPDEWFETINRSVGNMEYAAYNLCDGIDMSRFEGDNWFTTESTCPEASLLIAIRDIKALITPSHTTPDDPPSGWFRHYRHDVRETFTVRNENRRQITPEERNAMDRERREKRERRQREQEQRWAERAEYCRTLYESASPDDVLSHPYAVKKQWTAAPGIRRIQSIDKSQYFDDKTGVIRDALLVPIFSIYKKLWMVQAITPDGTKLFPSGVKKQGHFFPIKGPSDGPILMCEGVATGIALNAATGASVICTLDSGNLIAVDAILAEAAPERQRVACGDNDHGNPKNPGAKKAAQCQCPVLLPQFPLGADGGHTDWDDWLRHHGTPEELRSRLESVLSGPPDEPPEPEYDPDDSIPPADYFEPEPPTVDPGGTAGVYDDGMITFLGWDHSAAYYLPHGMRQPVRLTPSQHTKLNLFALVPNESYWLANYGDADTKRSGGGINWDWAASSMMSRSQARGIYDPGRVRGRGAWFDDGRSVVHAGDKLIVDGQQLGLSEIDSEFIYPVSKPLFVGMTDPAKTAEAVQFVELCEMIRWEEPIFGRLLAGWCFLAPICGAIEWRPHLWLTGPAGSGKSTVLKRIMKPALGGSDGMMIHAAGDTTEAGLRQRLRQDALPVVFDEFEREREKAAARVDDVLALVRQSSSDTGAEIIKGGAGGIADSYLIRSMFAFASIGIGMSSQADESRITVLTMKGSTREQQADPDTQGLTRAAVVGNLEANPLNPHRTPWP